MEELEVEDLLEDHGNELVSAIVVIASCFVNAIAAQPQIDNAKFVGDLIQALEAPAAADSFSSIAAEELRNRLKAALHQAVRRQSVSGTAA